MITIGFSSHRAETIPHAERLMAQHRIIVLEEPPHPGFTAMLSGRMPVDEYLMEIDSGFPEFDRLMCQTLKRCKAKGKVIRQVEPYLETLLQIHERLSEGKEPEDIERDRALASVYGAEKKATAALIDYYARSMERAFEPIIESVKRFAAADAERSRLRSLLRARAIAALDQTKDMYVESGYIHYPLYRFLRRETGEATRVRVVFLMQPVFRALGVKRRNMGPGDILTLSYALGTKIQEDRADLLAARSLMYIKLVRKEEMLPGRSLAPHSEDEAAVSALVDRLGYEDCRALFRRIRFEKRDKALDVVKTAIGV